MLFDVTPGRIIGEDETRLNLYLHGDEEKNRQQTDIEKQIAKIHKDIDDVSARKKARECIKFLKVWKYKHEKKMKSFFVELFIIQAFKEQDIDSIRGKWERLKAVIEFMRDNITTNIKLEDPGNNSNNVSDSLTDDEKESFKEDFTEMLEKIEADETKLKYYFPINEKYPCPEEEKKTGYNTAVTGNPSRNPTPTFG